MTIQEVITYLHTVKQHGYSDNMVKSWLNAVDADVFKNILSLYKESEETFEEYTDSTASSTELLVTEAPYSDIYKYYCMAQIDLLNAEMTGYDNNIALYNSVLNEYGNYVNRTRTIKNRVNFKYF